MLSQTTTHAAEPGVEPVQSATAEDRYARFERLVSVHIPVLTRVAIRNCSNRETAEDIVQETLLRAWRHLDRLRDAKAAKGWLFMILRNEQARVFGKASVTMVDVDIDTLSGVGADPDLDLFKLRHQINRMPEKYRKPLALFAIDGYGISEIASTLGIKQPTVKTRLHRAREQLRATILGGP